MGAYGATERHARCSSTVRPWFHKPSRLDQCAILRCRIFLACQAALEGCLQSDKSRIELQN